MCYFFNKLFRSSRRSLRICLYKIFSTMSLFWPPFMSIAMSERESYSPNTSVFIIVSSSSCLTTPPPPPPKFYLPLYRRISWWRVWWCFWRSAAWGERNRGDGLYLSFRERFWWWERFYGKSPWWFFLIHF